MQISKYITYKEATKSQTALNKNIDNRPDSVALGNMNFIAKAFDRIRDYFGKPIGISSFFRSPKLNTAIGGSATSEHCIGAAIDIDADIYNNGITNKQIFEFIKNNLEFNQLIWEFGDDNEPDWVHFSYRKDIKNKREILRARKVKGKTVYENY